MAVLLAIALAALVIGFVEASSGCSLLKANTTANGFGTEYTVSCEQSCAKWIINVTSYSSALTGRLSIVPRLLNPASWNPDAINATSDLDWSVSKNRSVASIKVARGQAFIEVSCFLDWTQVQLFGTAIIEQSSATPLATTTMDALPTTSTLSLSPTSVTWANVSVEGYPSHRATMPSEVNIEITPSVIVATPLATPSQHGPSSITSDDRDSILLSPTTVTLLPMEGSGSFVCQMKTDDPFVILNGSLIYPSDENENVSITAVSTGWKNWTVTVNVGANLNSTAVQCLSAGGNVTSASYLIVVGPPLPPNPQLLLSLDNNTVEVAWEKPFTWRHIADVTNYSIRVFNAQDDPPWKSMTIDASTNCTSFSCDDSACVAQEQNCTQPDVSLTYRVQLRGIAAQKTSCYTLQFYVSASSIVGKSESMLADKDLVVGLPLSPTAAPPFSVTPLYRPNGSSVFVTEIQAPNVCLGQILTYFVSVVDSNNITVDSQLFTKTIPHCNTSIVTDVVRGKMYTVTVVVNTFGSSIKKSYGIQALQRQSSSVWPSPSTVWTSNVAENVQSCLIQNSIVGAVSATIGLLFVAACVTSAILLWRIRARREKVSAVSRVERSNPLYELGTSHPYEQVNMKMRPLPPEPSSPNEDRYFMSPNDRSSRDISLAAQSPKAEVTPESPAADIKMAGGMEVL